MRNPIPHSSITACNDIDMMQSFVAQVWDLLVASYAQVSGGLNFSSKEDLMASSASWKLVLHHSRKVLAVTVYKAKKGLKLVAMATNQLFKDLARNALRLIISADLASCWMELSEQAERFVLKYCNGHRYIIHGSLVARLLDKPISMTDGDGFHYSRAINAQHKTKIALGTPRYW
ncbi:hypothetical protein CBP31_13010 [Oceanisphaera profunda]|uniref:Uncharacterized protein n=1 Tax=Oceanisphaera profunda TaxID=1416627 RepID=A0A1Y0D8I2_9GAMM|nr:hypothetical protein [Oceanisphaera profunda]ART83426.1 hypothetical protein CBP31_13010 [Oceanisphaera profunda]